MSLLEVRGHDVGELAEQSQQTQRGLFADEWTTLPARAYSHIVSERR